MFISRAYSKHAKNPQLATIRRNGWAIVLGESHPELAAISTPIFNREKELLGALTVSGPMTRFTAERVKSFRVAIVRTAQGLMTRMRFVHLQDLLK
jgi:IclR family KDG regulon transcriptional repressor